MKAATYTRYGDSSVVTITDIERPALKDDEILVAVQYDGVIPLAFAQRSLFGVAMTATSADFVIP